MANRIGPVDQGALGKIGNKVDGTGGTRKISGDSSASAGVSKNRAPAHDTVDLTTSAKLIEQLDKTLASSPDTDIARIAEVRTAIENGNYTIDADAIADAMIRFELSTAA